LPKGAQVVGSAQGGEMMQKCTQCKAMAHYDCDLCPKCETIMVLKRKIAELQDELAKLEPKTGSK